MNSEYTVLAKILLGITIFLYFSWFITSLRSNAQKDHAQRDDATLTKKSFLKSFVDPDISSKSVSFFLILVIVFIFFKSF
jgi:hypothetical protein